MGGHQEHLFYSLHWWTRWCNQGLLTHALSFKGRICNNQFAWARYEQYPQILIKRNYHGCEKVPDWLERFGIVCHSCFNCSEKEIYLNEYFV